ncbi:MAG TPA: FAD-dependent monooxygenase, partial [Candidatus Aquilonibacter sp.]
GYDVALIDARIFPRDKVCGEYLNAAAIGELENLGFGELVERGAPVESVRFSAFGATADIRLPRRARSIPRLILDNSIRTRAIQSGATPITGRLRSIVSSGSGVELAADRDGETRTIRARYAVGADGMRSAVARLLDLSRPSSPSSFALGGHYATPSIRKTLEIYLSPDGYYALNPSGQDRANVVWVLREGHLHRNARNLDRELARFSIEASNGRRALGDMVPLETRRAVGPLAHRTRAFTCENTILTGDAAAFVDPFTGHGIFLALAGARLASLALSSVLTNGHRRDAAWRSYERDLNELISGRKRLSWLVHSLVANRTLALCAAQVWHKAPIMLVPLIEAACGEPAFQ